VRHDSPTLAPFVGVTVTVLEDPWDIAEVYLHLFRNNGWLLRAGTVPARRLSKAAFQGTWLDYGRSVKGSSPIAATNSE
jgi:hypothetical protein